jgi:hypothetical protein
MIGRREFISLLGTAAVAWPLAARAQQPAKLPRIGFLGLAPASTFATRVEALRTGLRDLGYIEGTNIILEFRWAQTVDELPDLAAEFVRMRVAIIFAPVSTFVAPARQATSTIPIVFASLRQELVLPRQVRPPKVPHILRSAAVLLRRHQEAGRRRLDLPDLVGVGRHRPPSQPRKSAYLGF